MIRYSKLSFGTLLIAGAVPSVAADFPRTALFSMGFKEVILGDFRGDPMARLRVSSPHGYLSVTADFNADGKPDEARILVNDDRQVAYVVATIVTDAMVDTYVVAQFATAEIGRLGIEAAELRSAQAGAVKRPGLAIFDIATGKGEAAYFDGAEFNIRVPIAGMAAPLR